MHKKCMHVSFFHYVTLVWIIITHKYQFDDVGQPLPPPFPVGSILSKIYLHIYLRIVATYCRASVRLENVVLDLVKPHLYITVSLPIIYKVVDEFINIKRMSRKSIDMQLQYFADCLDTYNYVIWFWMIITESRFVKLNNLIMLVSFLQFRTYPNCMQGFPLRSWRWIGCFCRCCGRTDTAWTNGPPFLPNWHSIAVWIIIHLQIYNDHKMQSWRQKL